MPVLHLSFSKLNSIHVESRESVEVVCAKLFLVVSEMKLLELVFCKFQRFLRILILSTLKIKITKDSFLQIL